MRVPAWEPWLQAQLDVVLPRAGALPTREEIAAWYARQSFAGFWHDAQSAVQQWPAGVRVILGMALACFGAWLIWASYRRVRRPTQAELVRRASRSPLPPPEPEPTADIAPPTAPVGADQSASAAAVFADPVTPRVRSPRVQAFLTAEEFKQGRAPWAVPLSHDLLRIGRHQENDIRLEDKTVHRYHALLHRSPDGDFLIRDLSGDAGNGVYVNGARIAQTQLRPGDLVELGAVRLRFQQQRPS